MVINLVLPTQIFAINACGISPQNTHYFARSHN